MLLKNTKQTGRKICHKNCHGAVFVEYAIAVALLLAVFIVVNQIMELAFKQRAQKVIDNSDSMPVCDGSPEDFIRAYGGDDACL